SWITGTLLGGMMSSVLLSPGGESVARKRTPTSSYAARGELVPEHFPTDSARVTCDARRIGRKVLWHQFSARQGPQVAANPFVRLNVDAVQNAAALRYQTW